MNTKVVNGKQQQGSALMTAIIIFAVIVVALGSYLLLVRSQGLSVDSSQHWNAAMAHAEAGVEEAMAQLNHRFGTNVPLGANGWSQSGGGYVNPGTTYRGVAGARTLAGGAYTAKIIPGTTPVIYSTGYATVPISGNLLKRAVKVEAVPGSPFKVGMAAKLDINFKGNNILVDSFDSADPAHDDPLDPNEVKANGDVASTEGLVDVQNADIKGKLKVGPTGSNDIGPNGSVGDLSWPLGGGIQPGHLENDFNYDFKDVEPPFTSGVAPTEYAKKDSTNRWQLSGDYYYPGDAKFGTDENILVTGYTRLYVTGEFIMGGQTQINIVPGATLEIYVGGQNTDFTQVNTAGDALSFSYFGLPTNTQIKWSGNAFYKGAVYAPQATFICGGGGSTDNDYQGACVVNEVVLNGHFKFHYDENLGRKGKPVAYIVSHWEEL